MAMRVPWCRFAARLVNEQQTLAALRATFKVRPRVALAILDTFSPVPGLVGTEATESGGRWKAGWKASGCRFQGGPTPASTRRSAPSPDRARRVAPTVPGSTG